MEEDPRGRQMSQGAGIRCQHNGVCGGKGLAIEAGPPCLQPPPVDVRLPGKGGLGPNGTPKGAAGERGGNTSNGFNDIRAENTAII